MHDKQVTPARSARIIYLISICTDGVGSICFDVSILWSHLLAIIDCFLFCMTFYRLRACCFIEATIHTLLAPWCENLHFNDGRKAERRKGSPVDVASMHGICLSIFNEKVVYGHHWLNKMICLVLEYFHSNQPPHTVLVILFCLPQPATILPTAYFPSA